MENAQISEAGIDRLAYELNWIEEKLDPSNPATGALPDNSNGWSEYDEGEKDFFRAVVRNLLRRCSDEIHAHYKWLSSNYLIGGGLVLGE